MSPTITDDDIRFARRRARRERRIASIQKSLSVKGSWSPMFGMASHPEPAQTAGLYCAFLKALRGRRFDNNKGRSQVIFLSSDPRAPVRVTPEFVENMVGIYGDKIDDENSPIVRSFLSKCWIRKEAYQQWDTGTYEAATQPLKWGFDDPLGQFNQDDEIIVPEWLLKARDDLRGLDFKAWSGVVKMIRLLDMGQAKSANDAATRVEEWDPGRFGHSKEADITRLRKLCARLLKKRETGSA
jgi:hypothetical protein